MSEWRKLNQLCTKITDGSHFSPVGVESGYPMLSVKDMKENGFDYSNCKFINEDDYKSLLRNDCKPLKNDVLIAKDGSYLKHVFVIENEREEAILSSIGILRPNLKLIDPYYIKYYLDSDFVKREVAKKYVSGSALPRIILKNFGEILVPYIEKAKQTSIVNVLKSIDSKIALNNRINAELEAMAKTVYDYWFVQFDFPAPSPSGRAGVGSPYKSSGGKMVWCEELKREVPKGWEVKKIGEVATIKAGGDKPDVISSDKTKECPIPIYSNGISNDGLYGYTNKAIINSQSVTISARGTIGFCFLRNKPYVPIIRLISLTPNLKGSAKYFYEALTHFIFENSGSVQQQLTVPQVQNIKILYPNEDVLKMFDNITSPMIDRIEIIKEENQQLSSLRDWLLPMLMNGQVSVGAQEEMKVERLIAAEPESDYGIKT